MVFLNFAAVGYSPMSQVLILSDITHLYHSHLCL
jgi:hypothetical protein